MSAIEIVVLVLVIVNVLLLGCMFGLLNTMKHYVAETNRQMNFLIDRQGQINRYFIHLSGYIQGLMGCGVQQETEDLSVFDEDEDGKVLN